MNLEQFKIVSLFTHVGQMGFKTACLNLGQLDQSQTKTNEKLNDTIPCTLGNLLILFTGNKLR